MTHWPTNKTRKYFKYSHLPCVCEPRLCSCHTHNQIKTLTRGSKFTPFEEACSTVWNVLVSKLFHSTPLFFSENPNKEEFKTKWIPFQQQVKYLFFVMDIFNLWYGGFDIYSLSKWVWLNSWEDWFAVVGMELVS